MKLLLSTVLLSISLSTFAEIRETASMSEAVKTIIRGDLIIFDLDNTIMEPVQAFNAPIVEVEWTEFQETGKVISDLEAKKRLTSHGH